MIYLNFNFLNSTIFNYFLKNKNFLSLKKAFEDEIGAEVTVPEHNTVMGAVGAAIIARESAAKNKSRFRGFDADFGEVHTEEFTCSGCGNSCQVIRLMEGETQLGCFQDRCGRYQNGADA